MRKAQYYELIMTCYSNLDTISMTLWPNSDQTG